MRNRLVLLLMLALLAGPAAAETLVFTAIPDQDVTHLRERFGKVADYLSDKLDVDVRYIPVKSYAAAISAFRNNQVQLAWFGGLSGVRAQQLVPGSRAIAQGIEDQDFRTYFIAHKGSGLKAGADFPKSIAGRTFTFGSKGSTSGRLMPEYYIRKYFDKAPDDVFKRVGFSGNHSRTIALVSSGTYQVGAVNYEVWKRELDQGKIDTDKVQVIWKTPPYPDYHFAIRGDVDKRFGKGFTDRVQKALIGMHDRKFLDSFPRSGFVKADNADYTRILKIARTLDLVDH